ncbi:MAG: histidine kinase [Rikenellaceae bacterium]
MMVKERNILMIESIAIILLWTFVVLSPLLFIEDLDRNLSSAYVMWAECIIVGVVFFVNRFLLMPRWFFTRRYSRYILSLVLLFVLLTLFVVYFDGVKLILLIFGDEQLDSFSSVLGESSQSQSLGRIPMPDVPMGRAPLPNMPSGWGAPPLNVGRSSAPPIVSIIPPMYTLMVVSIIVIALDMGLNIAAKWVISEQKQAEINRERITAQLSNLQNQVSPHFFMNTLNNIHALVDIDSQRAKKTIIELSGLMDYLLYESSSEKLVSLRREINFLDSYINLMRLRYPRYVRIDFCYGYDVPLVKIPPLLFLNYIENSFKYGIDYDRDSFIRIDFRFDDESIVMCSENTNHSKIVNSSRHGLGLKNSRKRLDLLYGNRYNLTISSGEDIYSVTLKIPIL